MSKTNKHLHLHRVSLMTWGFLSLLLLMWGSLHLTGTLYAQEGIPHVSAQLLKSMRAEVAYMPEAFTIMTMINGVGIAYIRHWRKKKHLKPGQ